MKRKLRKGVFMVTYAFEKNKPIYVIQERKKHWKGWEFPKGGIERFETKKHAVKREIKEETGFNAIKIKNHHKKGKWIYEKELKDRPGLVGQTWHLYSVRIRKGKLKTDEKEHLSQKWVSYKEAMKLLTYKDQKECLKIVNEWIIKSLNK